MGSNDEYRLNKDREFNKPNGRALRRMALWARDDSPEVLGFI